MTEKTLYKKLQGMSGSELNALIFDLANLRKENLEWLEAKLKGENSIMDTVAYFKKKISAALLNESEISLRNAKKAIADFRKISNKPEHTIELMIFYTETGIDVENKFGDLYEAFYTSIELVFENAIEMLNANKALIPTYLKRLHRIVERSTEGWGHKDVLLDLLDNLNVTEGAEA